MNPTEQAHQAEPAEGKQVVALIGKDKAGPAPTDAFAAISIMWQRCEHQPGRRGVLRHSSESCTARAPEAESRRSGRQLVPLAIRRSTCRHMQFMRWQTV